MLKAPPHVHKKGSRPFTALCGQATFYSTNTDWRVTCPKCKELLIDEPLEKLIHLLPVGNGNNAMCGKFVIRGEYSLYRNEVTCIQCLNKYKKLYPRANA